MASRGGAVPVGTDGNDYLHRQRVAEHYQKRYGKLIRRKFFVTIFNQAGLYGIFFSLQLQKKK